MSNNDDDDDEESEKTTQSNEEPVTGVNPLNSDSFYRDSHDPDHFPKSLLDGYCRLVFRLKNNLLNSSFIQKNFKLYQNERVHCQLGRVIIKWCSAHLLYDLINYYSKNIY